jgi:hypothetical protein
VLSARDAFNHFILQDLIGIEILCILAYYFPFDANVRFESSAFFVLFGSSTWIVLIWCMGEKMLSKLLIILFCRETLSVDACVDYTTATGQFAQRSCTGSRCWDDRALCSVLIQEGGDFVY